MIANPEFTIELGIDTFPVRATEIMGKERDEILARWLARVPLFTRVVERTSRTIPVIRLVPVSR